jgi:hypothetical protein
VYLLGVPVGAGSFFPYVVSLSVLLQVLLLPITGAVADRTQNKKQLLALFAYLGAIATMGLYLTQGSAYLLGGLLFLIANVPKATSRPTLTKEPEGLLTVSPTRKIAVPTATARPVTRASFPPLLLDSAGQKLTLATPRLVLTPQPVYSELELAVQVYKLFQSGE